MSGNGAALGGGFFAMSSASVTFQGTGGTSGNSVKGGTSSGGSGASAGQGIFLAGAGSLTFDLQENEVFTIADEICDETGAVAAGEATATPASVQNGSDGLTASGGNGVWSASVTGKGSLTISGKNNLSGGVTVSGGILDVSESSSNIPHDLSVHGGARFVLRPPAGKSRQVGLKQLSLGNGAELHLNGWSRINAKSVSFAGSFSIELDPTGFRVGEPMPLISWNQVLGAFPSVRVSPGYDCSMQESSLIITKRT
jgi:autotransporter-associated beta strand protein